MTTGHFLGLRTAIYPVADVNKAKAWYAEAFGVAPYFDQPFYVGFNIGGFELGLMPAEAHAQPGLGGVGVYWGVADAQQAVDRLLKLGASALSPIQDVGEGIKTATLKDPFGNALGIIENPHFPSKA
jgi:predicted enzyme related to lactoylglutathione lyase